MNEVGSELELDLGGRGGRRFASRLIWVRLKWPVFSGNWL